MRLNICQNGVSVSGDLSYGPYTPISYNIMGPFAFFPFMECNHAIHSLYHTLQGSLQVNGQGINFDGGRGYIEQDWGCSFPKKYTWLQTNDFSRQGDSFFVSVAKIPFLGCIFTGCICVLRIHNKEYRLATYLGVRILEWTKSSLVLRQGNYTLQAIIRSFPGQKLLAPQSGSLNRIIHESPCLQANVALYYGSKRLFDETSHSASFEFVE